MTLWITTCSPLAAAATSGEPPPGRKMILISWDGAGDRVIDRLLSEGRMPHLAALTKRGTSARHLVGTLPSKTAPSHASIYTGCGPGVHGVEGNRTLYFEDPASHTVLETQRGFSSAVLTAEPLFVTTARAGLKTVILGATQYIPHAALEARLGDVAEGDFSSFSSFTAQLYRAAAIGPAAITEATGWSDLPNHRGAVREVDLGVPNLFGLLYDDPADPVEGFDRLLLRQDSKASDAAAEAVLEAKSAAPETGAWSPLLIARRGAEGARPAASGTTAFRLFALAPDGSELVLYRRLTAAISGHHSPAQLQTWSSVDSGVHDTPFGVHMRGGLGLPIFAGGDGSAEQRLLEIVAADIDWRIAGSRAAWQKWRPEALFLYSPISDQAGHAWTAAIDPASERYDPEIGEQLWPFYVQVFEHLDRWLGVLLELGGDQTILALVSDHGMASVNRLFNVQRALARADLLKFDASGQVDLARTKILAAESDFFLRVNDDRWQGGIVPLAERDHVIDAAADALLAVRDPETGRHPVRRIFTGDDLEHFAAAGPRSGDLYFDFAPGYYPTSRPSRRHREAVVYATPFATGQGSHGFWPGRRDMHAIFYLAGPGVVAGRTSPAARQIDVAPTLSKLLGIPAPAEACGRVLVEALVDVEDP